MKLKIKLYEPAGKSRSTSWRDRLKDRSPERYEEMLQKDRARKKTSYRAQQMDPSREARMQTKTRKEQVREAVARHRNKKKLLARSLKEIAQELAPPSDQARVLPNLSTPPSSVNLMKQYRCNMSQQKKQQIKM